LDLGAGFPLAPVVIGITDVKIDVARDLRRRRATYLFFQTGAQLLDLGAGHPLFRYGVPANGYCSLIKIPDSVQVTLAKPPNSAAILVFARHRLSAQHRPVCGAIGVAIRVVMAVPANVNVASITRLGVQRQPVALLDDTTECEGDVLAGLPTPFFECPGRLSPVREYEKVLHASLLHQNGVRHVRQL
jgi:hypothetical protein